MNHDLTTAKILQLAEEHVTMYSGRLEPAMQESYIVNTEETSYYLKIWASIRAKGGIWDALTPSEQLEVIEAIESE